MQIIYRNQLPGKAPRETRIDGFVAALFGALAVIVGAALLVILLPVFLLGVLVFFAFSHWWPDGCTWDSGSGSGIYGKSPVLCLGSALDVSPGRRGVGE
jgi:hypothetical protein